MSDLIQYIDDDTGLKKAFKKPSENRLYDVDCTKYMRASDTIASADNIASTLLSGSGTLTVPAQDLATDNQQLLQFRASSGVDGSRYKVTIGYTTTAGDILEADLVIELKEDF